MSCRRSAISLLLRQLCCKYCINAASRGRISRWNHASTSGAAITAPKMRGSTSSNSASVLLLIPRQHPAFRGGYVLVLLLRRHEQTKGVKAPPKKDRLVRNNNSSSAPEAQLRLFTLNLLPRVDELAQRTKVMQLLVMWPK